ncbi:hypothetical protein GM658_24995 [Pseudoduganella eburnea]|uniref:Uncharacterized protein n=1 Tax=Massilia eburnea TaxID=1776165 RepID=A0A6L6QNV7_9BURK|nr:hypothetical protein [Massilia eburnea]MTW13875.1 hypothetical protein [Massilia eburnea]
MFKPRPAAHQGPNLWHFSALAWGTSNLLLSLFAMPISLNPFGIRLQLCLGFAHFVGVFYLWRLAGKRGNPERLMELAIITLVFIYIVPLLMLAAPMIVLAAYALPPPAWQAVIAIMLLCAVILAIVRLWNAATDNSTGRYFDQFVRCELKEATITSSSMSYFLSHIGRHATQPSRIDGWTMVAAIAVGTPVLSSSIAYDKSSSTLAICALVTTPMAMHAFSRMVVHTYFWIYRLRRFERQAGIRILVNFRDRG